MATLAFQLAGYAIGGPVGAAIGGAIGNYLFAPEIPDTFGPRLSDLAAPSAREGSDIPITWGAQRIPGTVIWADPSFTQVAHSQEVGGKGGPESSTHTTYSYLATYAVAFGAPRPSSAKLRRLWMNKELVYDARTTSSGSLLPGLAITWYDGAQTAADPAIESYVGTGNAPAYTGTCYVVIENLDVTARFGNRRPSVEAEIVTDGDDSQIKYERYIKSTRTDAEQAQWHIRKSDGSLLALSSEDGNYRVDIGSRSVRPFSLVDGNGASVEAGVGVEIWYPFGYGDDVGYIVKQDGVGNPHLYDYLGNYITQITKTNLNSVQFTDGEFTVLFDQVSQGASWTQDLYVWAKYSGTVTEVTTAPPFWAANHTESAESRPVHLGDDEFMICFQGSGAPGAGEHYVVWAKYDADGGTWGDYVEIDTYYNRITGHPVLCSGKWWYGYQDPPTTFLLFGVDPDAMTVTTVDVGALGATLAQTPTYAQQILDADDVNGVIYFRGIYHAVNGGKHLHAYKISSGTLTTHTVDWGDDYDASAEAAASFTFDLSSLSIAAGPRKNDDGDMVMDFHRLALVDPNRIYTAGVIDDLCGLAGVADADIDTSAITSDIQGFTHSRVSGARGSLEQLLQLKKAYGYQDGYRLVFDNKGGDSVATISTNHLATRADSDNPQDPVTDYGPGETDIPARYALSYPSFTADYSPITQTARWWAGNDKREPTLSTTLAMTDSEAVDAAQYLLQSAYDPHVFTLSLPRAYSTLSPGDPITVPVDGTDTRMRITKLDRGVTGRMEIECVRDSVEDLTTSTTDSIAGRPDESIYDASTPDLLVLDTPLLRDIDDDHPGPYIAAYTAGSGSPMIGLYVSSDAGQYSNFAAVGVEAPVFVCETVPADVILDAWDSTNTLRIRALNGQTVSTATSAAVLAGANAAAWGAEGRWEIVQFQTATLISTGIYDLTTLLRGRRGTDGFMGDHADGDLFIVLSSNGAARNVLANADIGGTRYYKAARSGTSIADADAVAWTVGENPLKPYSPIDVTATHSSGDYDLAWTRRTRRGGAYGGTNGLVDGVGGPISEDSEEYEIDIYVGGAGSPVRQITSLSSAAYTYTAANQATDGTDVSDYAEVDIYQISAVADRGFGTGRVEYTSVAVRYKTDRVDQVLSGTGMDVYFALDEASGTTAEDTAGSSDATFNAEPTWGETGAMARSTGVDFAGTHYADFTYSDPATVFVLSAWIKGSAATGTEYLFGNTNFGLLFDGSARFGLTTLNSGDLQGMSSADTVILDGAWHHLYCLVYVNASPSISIWVDNSAQSVSQLVGSTQSISWANSCALGRLPGSGSNLLKSTLDNVACHSANVSASDRASLAAYS